MTKFKFQGTGETVSGWKAPVAIGAAVVLCSSAGAGTAMAHLPAVITDLVYWIAGVMGATAAAGAAALAWWLHGKPGREARAAALMAGRKRARAAELEGRAERRAISAARAQADAWSPLLAAFAGAMRQPQPQPWPQPAPVIIPSETQELPR